MSEHVSSNLNQYMFPLRKILLTLLLVTLCPALLANKVITNNDTRILNYRMHCIASCSQILIVPLFSRSVINYKNNCKVEQLFILQCLKVISVTFLVLRSLFFARNG